MGLFDRDYMRYPQGPDDAYFGWLNEVGLSSRTFEQTAGADSRPSATTVVQVLSWIAGSVLIGLTLGAALFFLSS